MNNIFYVKTMKYIEKKEFTVHEDGIITIEDGLIIKKEKIVEDNLIVFENTPKPSQV